MNDTLRSALQAIPVASLSYSDWIAVGMALKKEGVDCAVWEEWSQADSRFHAGECARKWATFQGHSSPVSGGTIVHLARTFGWCSPATAGPAFSWESTVLEQDGSSVRVDRAPWEEPEDWHPGQELAEYLRTLFSEEAYIRYVVDARQLEEGGKWMPIQGCFKQTVGEVLQKLEHYGDDLGSAIGECEPEAGAWICINPLDGQGGKNENVTQYRYALVECDSTPIPEQYATYIQLQLPIACLVHSGGKSLHAIVRVDARNYKEYKARVNFLYKHLLEHGLTLDTQNKNPSRLSRMPGVLRNGRKQFLLGTNLGKYSWGEWMEWVEGVQDNLPDVFTLRSVMKEPPAMPEELIGGILRRGHKMLIAGSSKAGKSFLLMELCLAIASGSPWLGFPCKKGEVLYINLEIDPASCIHRFLNIAEALQIDPTSMDNVKILNLRGKSMPLNQLAPQLIQKMKHYNLDAVIFDPIYKIITGDENNAADMGAFCNEFDRICTETGCSVIYCHHHSKGAQGAKRAMDRASGSGVFARDPDAQLDILQLELTEDLKNNVRDGGATAWRLETNLREFPNTGPVDFWFEYPIHYVDTTGELAKLGGAGSWQASLIKTGNYSTKESRRQALEEAYMLCSQGKEMVEVQELANYLSLSSETIRRYIREFSDGFHSKGGYVFRRSS